MIIFTLPQILHANAGGLRANPPLLHANPIVLRANCYWMLLDVTRCYWMLLAPPIPVFMRATRF